MKIFYADFWLACCTGHIFLPSLACALRLCSSGSQFVTTWQFKQCAEDYIFREGWRLRPSCSVADIWGKSWALKGLDGCTMPCSATNIGDGITAEPLHPGGWFNFFGLPILWWERGLWVKLNPVQNWAAWVQGHLARLAVGHGWNSLGNINLCNTSMF